MLLGINLFNKVVLLVSLMLVLPNQVVIRRWVISKGIIMSVIIGLMISGLGAYWKWKKKKPNEAGWFLVGDVLVIIVVTGILLVVSK